MTSVVNSQTWHRINQDNAYFSMRFHAYAEVTAATFFQVFIIAHPYRKRRIKARFGLKEIDCLQLVHILRHGKIGQALSIQLLRNRGHLEITVMPDKSKKLQILIEPSRNQIFYNVPTHNFQIQGTFSIHKKTPKSKHLKLPARESILKAIHEKKSVKAFQCLAENGANFNELKDGICILTEIVKVILNKQQPEEYSYIINTLTTLGMNPSQVDADHTSPLLHIIYADNEELMRIMLEAGANPNVEGFDETETLLDSAIFDYLVENIDQLEIYNYTPRLSTDIDAYLNHLNETANRENIKPPLVALTLRNHQAKTAKELDW